MTVVGLISNRDETTTGARWAAWPGGAVTTSLSECGEDEGDCRWLQESALSACSSDHQWCDRGESEQHQVPGCTHHEDLSWTNNTAALAKKAQRRLYFLRKLRRARAPAPIMCTFYRGTIESILTSCITVWYGACNASCRKSLQRIVRAAEKIVGVSPPPSRTSTAPVSPAKPSALQVIPPTRHTTSSVCYHQGRDCGVSKPGPTDWKTASSTRLSGSWTPSRPCPPLPLSPHHHITRKMWIHNTEFLREKKIHKAIVRINKSCFYSFK